MSFSALDLLTTPGCEPEILRCLSQRPRLTLGEIAKAIKLSPEELEPVVRQMVRERKLEENGHHQPATYSVSFTRAANRLPRNDTNDLLALFK